jgi:hypothetical protein
VSDVGRDLLKVRKVKLRWSKLGLAVDVVLGGIEPHVWSARIPRYDTPAVRFDRASELFALVNTRRGLWRSM